MSHCDDRRPEQLLVKLDNFGYARRLEGAAGASAGFKVLGQSLGPVPWHHDNDMI